MGGLGHIGRLRRMLGGLFVRRGPPPVEVADAESQRTRIALDAGEMGTWVWHMASGRVEWDARLEGLYGLPPGTFDGTFESYAARLHPDDRQRVLQAVDDAVREVRPFRFDHRVVWPDGSVHWIEGRGEPLVDKELRVVGAAGVAIDIDDRRRAEAERTALLAAEHEARRLAERAGEALQHLSELTMALSAAATVDEVAVVMVQHGIVALGADYGWFGTLDDDGDAIVTRAHQGYPEQMVSVGAGMVLDSTWPANDALRSGAPVFVESPEERRARYPQYPDDVAHDAFVVVPITSLETLRGVLAFGYSSARHFSDDDRRYIAAVVDACAEALRRAALFEAEQSSRSRLRTILDLSEMLARLDHPDAVLEATARFAAGRIGRYASVYVAEPGGLRRVAMVHADAALEPVLADLAAHGIDAAELAEKAAHTGEAFVLHQAPDAVAAHAHADPEVRRLLAVIHPTSAIVVPMRVSGRTRGVIVIGDDRPAALGAPDLELAIDLGRRAASAHERADLWQAGQVRLEAEHRMVQVLQQSIMPEELPDVPGAEVAAVYRPADLSVDVGGDWYDVFAVRDAVLLVVGDVAGHGLDAATLMGRVRNALRAYAVEDDDPASVLARVDHLLRTLDRDAMVTAAVARFHPATGEVTWARAGHPPPLLCDGGGGTRFLDDVNAPPLGTLAERFECGRARLAVGSVLVMYTDGLVERRDRSIDDGFAWLVERVRASHGEPAGRLCRALADDPFVPLPSADDICVLALRATQR